MPSRTLNAVYIAQQPIDRVSEVRDLGIYTVDSSLKVVFFNAYQNLTGHGY